MLAPMTIRCLPQILFHFLWEYTQSILDLGRSYLLIYLIYWRTSIIFSTVVAPVHLQQCNRIPFFWFLDNTCYLLLFCLKLPWLVCDSISLCFLIAFSWWLVTLGIFPCRSWPSICLLWKNFYLVPLLIFKSSYC